ncbi:MAG TPA: hypothetical protein VEB21_00635, partial [Terriglobales bacterium]|nr:hypothetical protein [Terriglobales bacterium]
MVVVAWGTLLLSISAAAPAFRLASLAELAVMMALVLAVDALVLWVVYGTAYWFDGERLRIRSGPLRLAVPVARIESVRP